MRNIMLIALVSLITTSLQPALAQEKITSPKSFEQVANNYTLPVGDFRITSLSDGTVPQDLYSLLIGSDKSHTDQLLEAEFLTNPVEASINVFLVQDSKRAILIDTGAGDLFGPGNGGKLLDGLKSTGLSPDDITDIIITHIHTDHTGGLVRKGKPVFKNATVHVSAPELTFFLNQSNSVKFKYPKQYFDEADMTIGVYHRIGKVKTFGDGETIIPGIMATLQPGHTPGSAFLTASSQGKAITFVGDIIHVASVQFPDPDVAIIYDVNPKEAISRRKTTFTKLSQDRTLIAAPHLPFPGIGYIGTVSENSFSWHPVEYRNRSN